MSWKLPITNKSIDRNCLHCKIIFIIYIVFNIVMVYICILINRLYFTKTIFLKILLSLVSSKSWNCVCFWQVIHDKTCLENQLKESHKLEIQNDKMSERKGEGLWGISPPYFPSPASFCSTLWIVHNAYCNKVYSYRLFR